MAVVSIVETAKWTDWTRNWPSSRNFFTNAIQALNGKANYVRSVHPEWQQRLNTLLQQGNALYAQMSALNDQANAINRFFANVQRRDPLGANAGSIVSSVLGPLAPVFFAPDSSITVSYSVEQARTIQNAAQQWAVLANNFVSQCVSAYAQEQRGATPAQTSAISGANVSSTLPALPSVLPSLNTIPVVGDIVAGAEHFVGSIGTTAKWIAIVGLGVVLFPAITDMVRSARRARR